jgi:hypothetical protein
VIYTSVGLSFYFKVPWMGSVWLDWSSKQMFMVPRWNLAGSLQFLGGTVQIVCTGALGVFTEMGAGVGETPLG